MAIVVVERGNDKGRSLKVQPGKRYVFGRDPSTSNIVLADPLTSRQHFEIRVDGDSFALKDLKSTNGTFVNDERIETVRLKVGDKIQVGETILSFLSDQKEETPQGLVGKSIGGYELHERVGRGGMGTVYRASQLSLNRIVAFKVLSSRLLKDVTFIERFKAEARAAGQLNHPNIVQVYDVGTHGRIQFFSMEFMDGQSLQDKIGKDGKLPWEEVLDVLMQAGRALVFAERKGIVHRDVKPDNLMLTSDGQVKLADLGLARRRDQKDVEEGIYGTPHFISPEQAQGKEIDHRADLYSLGATAYRLLAGRTPFVGNDIQEIISKQISADPPPLRESCPEAPDELIEIVAKLMRKKPEERYASAEELLADLEEIRLRYHLKVRGAKAASKGVLAAVAVAFLAVAAVIVFAVTRENDAPAPVIITTGTLDRPETGTVEIRVKDPEQAAEVALLKLENKEISELGDIEKTWRTRTPQWIALAEEYEALAAGHSGTQGARDAKKRATEIRETIDRKQREDRERFQKANQAWQSLRTNVKKALDAERYARAIRLLREAVEKEEVKFARSVLKEADDQIRTWLGDDRTPGSITALFIAAWSAKKTEAERLRADLDYPAAATLLKQYLEKAAEDEEGEPVDSVRTELGDILLRYINEYTTVLERRLEKDRALFYGAYRGIRHHEDAEGPFTGNPVFDFDFGAAADRMAALLADGNGAEVLKTTLFRERATRKVAQLRSLGTLMDALVRGFNEKTHASEELKFPRAVTGAPKEARGEWKVNRSKEPPATSEGINLLQKFRMHGADVTLEPFVKWSDLTAAQLYELVFLEGERWKMSPEDHAALARLLAELGVQEGLEKSIGAAGSTLPAWEREALTAELAAIRAWRRVLEGREKRPPEDWQLAVFEFLSSHFSTDYIVLV
ncbi:MAG: protein kinase domain-containing protein [Planctomycetota bacterium]